MLGNNGNATTRELDDYVQDDIFRYGAKLDDMHKKLRQALDEQVRENTHSGAYSAANSKLLDDLQVEPDEDDDEIGEDELML